MTIRDLLGREVKRLVSGMSQPGIHHLTFAAEGLPSGVYFYHVEANDQRKVGRMTIVRFAE